MAKLAKKPSKAVEAIKNPEAATLVTDQLLRGSDFSVGGVAASAGLGVEITPINGNSVLDQIAGPLDLFEEGSTNGHLTLEGELASTREYLQSIIEQAEATNKELHSANEEARSSNEELQSVNAELEASKEEIQSANEQLNTVNDELEARNEELGRVNNDLVNLIDSVNTAIVMVGRDLCIRRYSPEAEKLLNVIPSDLGGHIGRLRMNVTIPDLGSLLQQTIETISSREVEVQGTDGQWFLLRIRPYVTADKKIDGAVMTLHDIDVLKRGRDFAEAIIETVREPLVILDRALCVKTANRAYYETFGARDRAVGSPFFELEGGLWANSELRGKVEDVLQTDSSFENLNVTIDFGGTAPKALRINARRIDAPDSEEPMILLAIEDVSERKRHEVELAVSGRRARSELEHRVEERTHDLQLANKEIEGFSYTVAHDLRAPLRTIIFTSRALLEELGQDLSEEHLALLNRQAANAAKLGQLIDDLLQFSRITRVQLKRSTVDITKLTQGIIRSLQESLETTCTFEVMADMHAEGDDALLSVAFANLLDNACKFSPDGGTIEIGVRNSEAGSVFFVRDRGIGIELAYAKKIFEPFERLHNEADFPGTGIGLATVKRVVERHGGKVWIESEFGNGSTFFFTLANEADARLP